MCTPPPTMWVVPKAGTHHISIRMWTKPPCPAIGAGRFFCWWCAGKLLDIPHWMSDMTQTEAYEGMTNIEGLMRLPVA